MNVRRPLALTLSPERLVVLVVILGLSFGAVVLLPGLKLASELVRSSAVLKWVGEQQRYPTALRASLETMRDRLTNRGYIQESQDQIKDSSQKLETALADLTAPRTGGFLGLSAPSADNSLAGPHARILREVWAKEKAELAPVIAFSGLPYADSESAGSVLNAQGRDLERDLTAVIRTSRHLLPQLDTELGAVGSELQADNTRAAKQLQLVMLLGLLIAGALVLLIVMLLNARKHQEARLREARQQTADILRNVKDGLFLLDPDLVIGSAYSSAMETLFQRQDLAGLKFEALLEGIVSEKTLATALKFVKVLWAERTNEKLVKSINPLGEVEVHFPAGPGKFDTRYLDFGFHRVRVDGAITHVLVSVSDVSSRVELARELQSSQQQAQAQVDTLLGILHIDPTSLSSFLSDSNAAMKLINAVLKEPAREESAFRKKLDTLFRQAHSVKGEAAALGLSSIESRAHSFEDDLKKLREKSDLSGNDFLPLVIKLDDLLTHLQSVSDLVSRLAKFQVLRSEAPGPQVELRGNAPPAVHFDAAPAGEATSDAGLGPVLQQLCDRVAADGGKEARVYCRGLDKVPEDYRRIVKDIAIQAVRNAVVHGIEGAADRAAAGKPAVGSVRVDFKVAADGGYKLSVEDDGQGLVTERIKETALQKGFITADQVETLDARQVLALLFQPGFSTMETATKDAGRGVGMNLMADHMRQIGGRVGVATAPGKFTRVTMTLPAPLKPAGDIEAA
ncbi:MAG TPA: ATP-binding protein [Steroidobacteraceae bacterium]|jgi:HPt (histidine-containing phosphotransfer) domain-containing protein|nr:ATP-binding protein [Steroidobacteraceae bacterium]